MKVIIIGAGFSGLGAGIELLNNNIEFSILEKDLEPGGLVKTDNINGFLFDISGHYLHIQDDDGYERLIKNTVPFDNIKRKSAVNVKGVTLPYPIQYNLRFLNKTDIMQIIDELSIIKNVSSLELKTLKDYFLSNFGEKLFSLFFEPYNEKLWGTKLQNLPSDCLGGFFPKINYQKIINGSKKNTPFEGYNNTFYYPKSGRIDSLTKHLANKVLPYIKYDTDIISIDIENKNVIDKEGKIYKYDILLNSMPLERIQSMIKGHPLTSPSLSSSNIINTRVGFKGSLNHPYHWIYVPDKNLPFYRIGFPKNINPTTCPDGFSSLSIETNQTSLNYSEEELASLAIKYLENNNLVSSEEILFSENKLITPAYTSIPWSQRKEYHDYIHHLSEKGIHMIGRYGLWKYYSMEDAYLSGYKKAKELAELPYSSPPFSAFI